MSFFNKLILCNIGGNKVKIVFSGDRNSKTIKLGKLLRKIFGKKIVGIDLWDRYKSHIYIGGKRWA